MIVALLLGTALAVASSAGDVRAEIRLAPTLVGPATLRIVLRDAGGKPIDDAIVTAHVDMTTMEMEPGFKPLTHAPHGTYVRRLQLSMPGHYHVEVRVARRGHPIRMLDAPVFIDIP
ncbi:MAG: hypothetical protein NVSMB64_19670 [Candidatus Velthaea sp.]